jgi:hypothetical protein
MQWYHTPAVTTPLLKLMSEVVYNKAQRLTFDSSSPNGILLFRETSSLIFVFGTRILAHKPPAGANLYEHKYKGIGIALLTLQRALSGNYVNFGVFALYGDKALDDVLSIAIQLCLSMELGEMMSYPKVAKTYFTLVDILMRNHTATMVKLETAVLAHITNTLQVSAPVGRGWEGGGGSVAVGRGWERAGGTSGGSSRKSRPSQGCAHHLPVGRQGLQSVQVCSLRLPSRLSRTAPV